MEVEAAIQQRTMGPEDICLVRGLLEAQPSWNRTALSMELCRRWGWRNGVGQLKDMACRNWLLKLERQGHIQLPARQSISPNGFRHRQLAEVAHDSNPIAGELKMLRPLQIEVLTESDANLALFRFLLDRYHYLGLRHDVGQNLKYLVRDRQSRILACVLFGSAAWKAKARDEVIGWDASGRQRNLAGVANNLRFLILPWVRISHLASHVLGQIARRIGEDWANKYGQPIHLLETFVQRDRFKGTCYRAAGWRHVGATAGRGRNDVQNLCQTSVKDVYLYPLTTDFRRRLCA